MYTKSRVVPAKPKIPQMYDRRYSFPVRLGNDEAKRNCQETQHSVGPDDVKSVGCAPNPHLNEKNVSRNFKCYLAYLLLVCFKTFLWCSVLELITNTNFGICQSDQIVRISFIFI